ncbi:MAG: dihydrodipicolinate reductase [Bacillota bacterium]|nr:dihydrodipicolinate reductase [Bacillota bacterium]
MKKEITFVQFGCGRMGRHTAQYAIDKGAKLVAAFDMNPDIVGMDFGEFLKKENMNVKIHSTEDADKVFKELKPEICIITTQSLMKDVKDIMITCARNGINAISTCEEAIYPWNSSPAITEEIDRIAKENGCTITGTGANESQYGGMFALFGGNTHKTNRIIAKAQYNVDDYGIALAKGHGVGLTAEEFEREIAAADNISDEERNALIEKGEFLPSYVWNTNGWICDYLGLTIKHQTQTCIPKFADVDIRSETMDAIIPAGKAIGMGAICTTQTEEGLTIETECIGIVYGQGEEDINTLTTFGTPNTEAFVRKPATVEMTCATIVNRIPDVINAAAGFVTTSKMPILKYRVKL